MNLYEGLFNTTYDSVQLLKLQSMLPPIDDDV